MLWFALAYRFRYCTGEMFSHARKCRSKVRISLYPTAIDAARERKGPRERVVANDAILSAYEERGNDFRNGIRTCILAAGVAGDAGLGVAMLCFAARHA